MGKRDGKKGMAEGRDERNERRGRSSSFMEKGHRRESASLWEGGAIFGSLPQCLASKGDEECRCGFAQQTAQRSCVSAVLVTGQEPGAWPNWRDYAHGG